MTIKKAKIKSLTSKEKKTTSKKAAKTKVKVAVKKAPVAPTSMEELLQQTNYILHTFKKGNIVKGVITDKGRKSVFFDIGAKTEGVITGRELEFVQEYLDRLHVGDTVDVRIVSPENEKGQILLSLREAANDWKWNLLDQYYKSGEAVEVRGLDVNRGGMIARMMGIRGFIPTSQFGRKWAAGLDQLYNKLFPVKIIEVDREKNRLIFSEKAVSEEETLKHQEEAAKGVKTGQVYEGEISGVMPFGLFIRVPVAVTSKQSKKTAETTTEPVFLDGLVHISQVSWEKVDDLKKQFQVGQKIKVKVLDVDQKSGKLNLSLKQLQPDPWEEVGKKYKEDKKCKGIISRLAAFGAFVQLEPGVEGLIHISKIPTDKEIKVGDEVEVYIEALDVKQRRISLGMVLSAKPVGYK